MGNTTEGVGRVGVNEADEAAAGRIGYVPDEGALTLTIANRIDPSGHVFLMSVCVGKLATWSPPVAAPCGKAWPNVAQPGVRPTVATLLVCAAAGWASDTSSANAARSAHRSRAPDRRASTRSLAARLVAFSIGNVTANERRPGFDRHGRAAIRSPRAVDFDRRKRSQSVFGRSVQSLKVQTFKGLRYPAGQLRVRGDQRARAGGVPAGTASRD